jgi:hypothetical protein
MCVFTGELLRRSISGASSGAIVRDLDLTQLKNALFGKCPLPVNGQMLAPSVDYKLCRAQPWNNIKPDVKKCEIII